MELTKPKLSLLNTTALVQYFLLFIFVTVHGSVYWIAVWRDIPVKPAIIFFIVFFVWSIFKLSIHRFVIIYIFFNIIIHGLDGYIQEKQIITSEALQAVMPYLVYVFLVWVFYKLNPEKALTRFMKFVAFLSAFSIVCFTIQTIFGVNSFSPISHMLSERGLYGFLLYSGATNDLLRNYGMFGEPGIYQIIINTAIFIMLFWKDRLFFSGTEYKTILTILIITLITINSTIGFIEFGCLLCGAIFTSSHIMKKRIISIATVIVVMALADYFFNGDESIIIKNLIDKIVAMDIGNHVDGFDENTSGGARLYILSIVADAFRNNMLWGIGDSGLMNLLSLSARWQEGGTGNALGIYLIRRGIIPTLSVIIPILYRCYKNKRAAVEFWMIILLFFITTLAQSQIMYASYILIAFGDMCKSTRKLEST